MTIDILAGKYRGASRAWNVCGEMMFPTVYAIVPGFKEYLVSHIVQQCDPSHTKTHAAWIWVRGNASALLTYTRNGDFLRRPSNIGGLKSQNRSPSYRDATAKIVPN